ncbi:PREDICTED: probable NAD(P)H dehydrogenase subunit CRR3, chloroplastic [Ipomoea nil]|uniref:probable NAD(P)H dehydrogenase subunit CRR3, chloroplastic n=1 Tax=Ipomoea nil TaxID=35883 RepID=UPI000900DDC6|nr:PREDICTED: probable NAD(P)H dehydrogenase subunit CRR3, chloroplastic [Ipomoea nil]
MSPLRLLSKNQPTNNKYLPPISFAEEGNQAATYSTMAAKCFSISNTQILACAGHNSSSSTSHSIPKTSPSLPKFNTPTSSQKLKHPKNKHKNSTRPSIAEIERAIGAGVFRDPAIYKRVESGSDVGGEWPVEKKLREVGEWLLAATETSPDTSSRKILKTVFLWILPMWVLAFLVAARIIHLPFTSPFLDDLLL